MDIVVNSLSEKETLRIGEAKLEFSGKSVSNTNTDIQVRSSCMKQGKKAIWKKHYGKRLNDVCS